MLFGEEFNCRSQNCEKAICSSFLLGCVWEYDQLCILRPHPREESLVAFSWFIRIVNCIAKLIPNLCRRWSAVSSCWSSQGPAECCNYRTAFCAMWLRVGNPSLKKAVNSIKPEESTAWMSPDPPLLGHSCFELLTRRCCFHCVFARNSCVIQTPWPCPQAFATSKIFSPVLNTEGEDLEVV